MTYTVKSSQTGKLLLYPTSTIHFHSRQAHLLGAVENPYPYYLQSDVYVHATRFEGRSIAVQEAQTLGCAVVVSNASGNRRQVEQNRDGLLCDLTPKAVSTAVGILLSDKRRRRRLGAAARVKRAASQEAVKAILEL